MEGMGMGKLRDAVWVVKGGQVLVLHLVQLVLRVLNREWLLILYSSDCFTVSSPPMIFLVAIAKANTSLAA